MMLILLSTLQRFPKKTTFHYWNLQYGPRNTSMQNILRIRVNDHWITRHATVMWFTWFEQILRCRIGCEHVSQSIKGPHSYNIRVPSWNRFAMWQERQYNQFFILRVYELELQFIKQRRSFCANMRAYELYCLSRACHILFEITSVKAVYVELFSWSSQFHTVVFRTLQQLTLRPPPCDVMWTVFTADLGVTGLLKISHNISEVAVL